jgi:hypothetical protein
MVGSATVTYLENVRFGVLLLLVAVPTGGAELNMLSFDFANDQTGAFTLEDTDGGVPPGTMSWSSGFGTPAGSLKLFSDSPEPIQRTQAVSACVDWDTRFRARWEADVFPKATSFCGITFQGFAQPSCGERPPTFGNPPEFAFPFDQWSGVTFPVPVYEGISEPFVLSYRFVLTLRGPGECHFDNVRLVREAEEIPALSPWGLLGLAAGVAGLGVLVLRGGG